MSRLLLPALALLTACHGGKNASDTGVLPDDTATHVGGGGDDSGTQETGDPGEDLLSATIKGQVKVELYTVGDDGTRESVSFDDVYGGAFPFGAIWVSAYTLGGDGTQTYRGNATVSSPSPDGDGYQIDARIPVGGNVYVYASLDYGADGIIQNNEPVGVYPDALVLSEGDQVQDVDITILVDASGYTSGGGGGGDDGGGTGTGWGEGSGCDDVTMSGPVNVTVPYTGSRGVAMITNTVGLDPYDYSWFTVSATPDGAEGFYSLSTCGGLGPMYLLGIYDSNNNALIDPSDEWGGYVTEPEVDGNPVTIETTDLPDHELEIPLESVSSGLGVVPFVQLDGTVTVDGGSFDDLPAGTTVYVSALKYRPNTDLAVTALIAQSYDYQKWEWADLVGQTVKDFTLGVPANTTLYLWAYADIDGDDIVNESGEPIASGGSDDDGTVTVDDHGSTHDLPLQSAESR